MKNFAAIPDTYAQWGQNFYDGGVQPVQQQIDLINSRANECRWWYEPIFKDDSKRLPVSSSQTMEVKNPLVLIDELKGDVDLSRKTSSEINKKNDYTNILIVGLGVIVALKLLS
jgi:hypothetical protein